MYKQYLFISVKYRGSLKRFTSQVIGYIENKFLIVEFNHVNRQNIVSIQIPLHDPRFR